ncbi:MAG: nucleoside triphosphate pyrophosphohydrolase [Acidobacteriota bacterium]
MAEPGARFDELVELMRRLRGPGGCPWDAEQTLESLRSYLIEETYEVLEAIEAGEPGLLREELGDLLLQVVFLSQVCSERGLFEIGAVVADIRDKLVRRHPHVFGPRPAGDSGEAIQRWEEIKNQERKASGKSDGSLLGGVPRKLPALLRASLLSSKAAMVGFDWRELEELFGKLEEEIGEFRQEAGARNRAGMTEELGDLLFIAANIGRFTGIDPELALQAANEKFRARFRHIEKQLDREGKTPQGAGLERMEELWEEAKKLERAGDRPSG